MKSISSRSKLCRTKWESVLHCMNVCVVFFQCVELLNFSALPKYSAASPLLGWYSISLLSSRLLNFLLMLHSWVKLSWCCESSNFIQLVFLVFACHVVQELSPLLPKALDMTVADEESMDGPSSVDPSLNDTCSYQGDYVTENTPMSSRKKKVIAHRINFHVN